MGISDKLETYLRLKLALDRLSDAYIGLSLEEYLSVMDGKALAFWNDQDSDRLKRLTERDEPKKVIVKETGDHIVQVRCPVCNEVLKDDGSESSFCPICGQRLDWSCEEEKENG
jgi:ssDNA-binding Zn-finger/Zn-ribbon topoisomerase 1